MWTPPSAAAGAIPLTIPILMPTMSGAVLGSGKGARGHPLTGRARACRSLLKRLFNRLIIAVCID
jgi:hypothetical protein